MGFQLIGPGLLSLTIIHGSGFRVEFQRWKCRVRAGNIHGTDGSPERSFLIRNVVMLCNDSCHVSQILSPDRPTIYR